jgi:hypothetical protein
MQYYKDGLGAIARSNPYAAYVKSVYHDKPNYISNHETLNIDDGPSSISSVSSSGPASISSQTKETNKPLLTTDLTKGSTPHRDWSVIFNQFIEEKERAKTVNEYYTVFSKFQQLATDFKMAASEIAKTIIDEAYLPLEKKTIKPIDAGGIAGGQKVLFTFSFICHIINIKTSMLNTLEPKLKPNTH